MSAQTVWRCIKIYRTQSYYRIWKAYGYRDWAAVQALEGYSGKDEYHGHGSGKPGDAEAPNATANLNSAIDFLANNVPDDVGSGGKGSVNNALKRANLAVLEAMTQIINDEKVNFGQKREILGLLMPTWEDNKKIKQEFDRVQAAYKASFKAKS